jgi:SpoVK/Ycf46/Vps4 family AAA+-type ATPase
LPVSAAALHDKWVGGTESRIDLLFQDAIANRPALLFIDEIEPRKRHGRIGEEAG